MTQYYHTPIPLLAAADAATFRSPFGELDAAIYRAVGSGTSFPVTPVEGDMFWRTDSNLKYVYDGSSWQTVNTSAATAGVVDAEGTAGEALSERDEVYVDPGTGKWKKIDIDATPPLLSAIRGFVAESGGILNNAVGTIRVRGVLGGFAGLNAGGYVYASTVAGGYTQTRPTVAAGGVQKAVVLMGIAISTTEVLILPARVEYLKRASLANNGTLTIQHHADAAGRTRGISATISTTIAGSALTEYASANYDTDVWLRGETGAGGSTSNATGGSANAVGDTGANLRWRSQGFQITAGRLSQITFDLLANSGTPSGTMTVEIHTNNAGVPSGTILWSTTLTPTASATNTINIANGIFLAASTTYHVVWRPTNAQTAGNAWNLSISAANPYANGDESQSSDSGANWSADAGYDNIFSVTTAAETTKDKLAQSFQIATTAPVDSATLYLKKVGAPAGTMTLRIETDNAGSPSGTLADANATVTLGESTLATSFGDIAFDFATNFSLTGTTTYWLVLSTDRAASGTAYVIWGSDASSPGYTDGVMKSEASSSWSAETKDAVFSVLGEGVTYEEPCATGRWSGGTRDVAVRYDDGAGADADTKSTAKNVIGSTVDLTMIVRLP